MSGMNQRFPGNSLTRVVVGRLFRKMPPSTKCRNLFIETLERISAKLKKAKMIKSSLESGRENDSPGCFELAILLGSFPARAELALLCFSQNLPHAECKKAFEWVKEGHEFGCQNCSGMLARFYATGLRGVVECCDEMAYRLACASAAAGSCFGKMALTHFLKSLLGPIDPDEEDTYNVLWTDPFIRNFNSPSIYVPAEDVPPIEENPSADEDDPFKDWSESDLEDLFGVDYNILMDFQIRRIVELLIEEIQQERARNPNCPKVWLNLPAI